MASLAITNDGTGITVATMYEAGTLSATGGGGSGFAGTYTISPTLGIASITGDAGVAGQNTGTVAWTTSGGGGSGATGTAIYSSGGHVTSWTVTNAGSGYTSTVGLTIIPAQYEWNDPGQISITIDGVNGTINGTSITNAGVGYTTAPTIVISDTGGVGGVITPTLTSPGATPAPLNAAKTNAKDAWTVRGSADLPPWGGTYILRKTYLNRTEEGSLSTAIEGSSGNATTSNPRRKTIDYFVRPVRP
ncbi:uncharacterized protein METZ01_LOCUS471611, partial [marine metagenome]